MHPLITPINEHVQIETLAPRTVIAWEPISNTGSITYECANYYQLKEDGSYFGQPTPAVGHTVSLEEAMADVIDVEVAPGVFQPVPMALVAGAIKAHFKKIMAEKRGGGGAA